MSRLASGTPTQVIWHEAENCGYSADLPLWDRLAAERGGPILELGSGTGRVALRLAAGGHEIVAVDRDPFLLAALEGKAAGRALAVETSRADVRELDLGRAFELVIAPMQVLHLLGGTKGRLRALDRVADHLEPGGLFAAAMLPEPLPPSGEPEPLPDVREVDGWVHSSLPIEVRVSDSWLEIIRLRQIVSPAGELSEETDVTFVDRVPLAQLDREAEVCGLNPAGRMEVTETDHYVGSVVALYERAGDG